MAKLNFTPFPKLVTDRLILRRLSENDNEEIFSLRSDERVNKYLDRQVQSDSDEAIEFIKKINEAISQNKSVYWAICFKDRKELIGTICLFGFSDDNTVAEIGYELHPAFQKRGLMNEAFKAVLEFALNNLNLKTIEASVHKNNDSSTKLLEKNHFNIDTNRIDKENINYIIYSLTR